jgi:hypothetical protein
MPNNLSRALVPATRQFGVLPDPIILRFRESSQRSFCLSDIAYGFVNCRVFDALLIDIFTLRGLARQTRAGQ